ncbi:MAG: ABC transporter permease [Acidobacteriota bacterium]|jgi:putative ABC transport system permease protein
MLLLDGIRQALRSIAAHKLRTFLTLLANVVAVSSVIAIVSILGGMDSYMKETVAGQGSGIVTLTRVDQLKILGSLDEFLESLRNPRITLRDVDYLRDNLVLADEIDAQLSTSDRVTYRERYIDGIQLYGRYATYPSFGKMDIAEGRHFTHVEVQAKSPVVVIGPEIAEALWPDQDPLGRSLKIGRRHFRVVGVLADQPSVLGRSQNRRLFIPITTYQKIYGTRDSIDVLIKVGDIDRIQDAVSEITTVMRIRHSLRPRERNDFEVTTSAGLVSLWESISQTIFMSLIGISAISLVIGGIIIMNIMLVSVTERIREIGLRKALGAKRSSILWQILVESMTLSSTGGLIGIAAGFIVASIVGAFTPLPYTIAPWAIVAGMLVTVGTGVFFGIYPASQAARLDPIEALRHE